MYNECFKLTKYIVTYFLQTFKQYFSQCIIHFVYLCRAET